MKKVAIIVSCLLTLLTAVAQDSAFQLQRTIPLVATDFAVDHFDNLYILTATDRLKKFNVAGDSVGVFNDVKRYGKVYSIDVSNPLRVLLFYKDFSSIVLLDRLLTQKGVLDLRRHRIGQASAAAISYDNNIWVFDALESKLKKMDEGGKVLLETPDFRQLFGISISPEKIIDTDGWVYLYDFKEGVFVFDYYGTFRKKFPLSNWASFGVLNKRFAGIQNGMLTFYNPSTFMQQQYQFPSSFGSFSRYLIGNTKLFALSKDSLSIYTIRY